MPQGDPIRIMTDYGTLAAPMVKTAPQPKNGRPAVDPVGRRNDRMVVGSHYRLPERRDLANKDLQILPTRAQVGVLFAQFRPLTSGDRSIDII